MLFREVSMPPYVYEENSRTRVSACATSCGVHLPKVCAPSRKKQCHGHACPGHYVYPFLWAFIPIIYLLFPQNWPHNPFFNTLHIITRVHRHLVPAMQTIRRLCAPGCSDTEMSWPGTRNIRRKEMKNSVIFQSDSRKRSDLQTCCDFHTSVTLQETLSSRQVSGRIMHMDALMCIPISFVSPSHRESVMFVSDTTDICRTS